MSTEQTIREELATCTRILVMKELIGLYGHVSRYDPESKRVYLSPGAGADRATTRPEDLWVLSLEGEVLEGHERIAAEWPIHTTIHSLRSDALAVAHLHSPYATLFAIGQRELAPVTLTGMMLGGRLPLYEEPALVRTAEQGQRLASVLGQRRAVLMRGHGVTVVASSIDELLLAALVLEDNARKAWQAAALGEVRAFTDADCDFANSGVPFGHTPIAWEYFCRQEQRWDRQPGHGDNPLS
jgi:ribulose-5-phosphate 4-epimerase/fuculose-1-phosphate aldolase